MTGPSPRVVFIGAGSVELTRDILADVLSFAELSEANIVLHDIDPDRLEVAAAIARPTNEAVGGVVLAEAPRATASPR